MENVGLKEVKTVFATLIDHPPNERRRLLDSTCNGNEPLRRQVLRLLEAHEREEGILETPASNFLDDEFTTFDETPPTPERIGDYEIVRIIASGGMGVVYEARQPFPRRPVAIKMLRRHLGSRSAFHRFREEAQILGWLRHSAIAQIHAASVHQEGGESLPYLVMEYVPNARPITRYADEENLSVEERIRLFIEVCEGVHHGHQKGVIHRDLKPDNILIDASGQPKIIDFGVARVVDSDVAIVTRRTNTGQLVGTLQYMSPEQLGAEANEIDTRSDVYSLGAVLYELLAGRPPVDIHDLTIPEALRKLSDERPASLRRHVRGIDRDLELIVLKSIEREPGRRYRSVEALTGDLKRYLRLEALTVRPPTLGYQVRVLARRHRPMVLALGALAATLVAATATSTSFFLAASAARESVVQERNRAVAVEAFWDKATLAAAPSRKGEEIPYPAILDAAAQLLDQGELADQPLAEASARTTLARAYEKQYMADEAEPHYRRAYEIHQTKYGADDRRTIASLLEVVLNMNKRNDFRDEPGRSVHERCVQLFGADDELTRRALHARAMTAPAGPLDREAWRLLWESDQRTFGPGSPQARFGQRMFAFALVGSGDPQRGRRLLEEALREHFSHQNEQVQLCPRIHLSITYSQLGLIPEARDVVARYADWPAEKPISPDLIWANVEHARALAAEGRLAQAEAALHRAHDRSRRMLGEDTVSPPGAGVLIDILREMGRLDEACAIADAVIQPDAAAPLWISELRRECGELDAAESLARESLGAARAVWHTDQQFDVALAQLVLAEALVRKGEFAEAASHLSASMATREALCEPAHPDHARARRLLGSILTHQGDYAGAEQSLREAIALDIEHRGADNRAVAKSRLYLGRFLIDSGRLDEARAELIEARRIFESSPFTEGLWLPRVEAALSEAGI